MTSWGDALIVPAAIRWIRDLGLLRPGAARSLQGLRTQSNFASFARRFAIHRTLGDTVG